MKHYIYGNVQIPLIGYWGADKKKIPDKVEVITLEFFDSLNKNVKRVYEQGLHFHFFLADTHAIINGHNPYPYLKKMEKMFMDRGITFEYMLNSVSLINKRTYASKQDIEKAKKHTVGNPVIAAQKYNAQRYEENRYIEKNYPNHIFHTFNGPNEKKIHPNLPTLYLYSNKGYCEAPWHVIKP